VTNPTTQEQGRFVWHELNTPDPDRACRFYADLFGYTTRTMEMGQAGSYTILQNDGRDVGGVWKTEAHSNTRSGWVAYTTVADLEAAASTIPQLGGEVLIPPTEVPGVGRFAIFQDPHGAVICPFRFGEDAPPEAIGSYPVGAVCWNELVTPNLEEAARFYTGVFGWSVREQKLDGIGAYMVFQRNGKDTAGARRPPQGAPCPGGWMVYIRVENVDRAAGRAKELGGRVMAPPEDIPGIGRYAVLTDPDGSVFAVLTPESRKN
jgi:predicted enzyme related to lactoylglutathione lyase